MNMSIYKRFSYRFRVLQNYIYYYFPKFLYCLVSNKYRILGAFLHSRSRRTSDFFFVQIGSHTGTSGDPIHEYIMDYGWHGILVEPVRELFEKLRLNYKDSTGLVFENVAIADEDGKRKFYRLRPTQDKMPIWYDQLGSLLPDVLLKAEKTIPNIRDYLIVEEVNCLTFQTLLSRNRVKKIDLLHIDTEGYDYEIIKQIDFQKMKPGMILFEHLHLKAENLNVCLQMLKRERYTIVKMEADIFAYR